MALKEIKFNRSLALAAAKASTSQDTVYFTTDTHQIVMGGEVYDTNTTYTLADASNLGLVKLTDSIVHGATATDTVPSVHAVCVAIDDLQSHLSGAMVFKGTVSSNTDVPASPKSGDTYKVTGTLTADTTKKIPAAKTGDVIVWNGSQWVLIPAGDESFTDTWRPVHVNGEEKLGSAISTGSVDFVNGTLTTAAYTATGKVSFSHNTVAAPTSTTGTAQTLDFGGKFSILSAPTTDSYGHITGYTTTEYTLPTRPVDLNQTVKAGTVTFGENKVVDFVGSEGITVIGNNTNDSITIGHSNTVTAGTSYAGSSTASAGLSLGNLPGTVTYDANGHITSASASGTALYAPIATASGLGVVKVGSVITSTDGYTAVVADSNGKLYVADSAAPGDAKLQVVVKDSASAVGAAAEVISMNDSSDVTVTFAGALMASASNTWGTYWDE